MHASPGNKASVAYIMEDDGDAPNVGPTPKNLILKPQLNH